MKNLNIVNKRLPANEKPYHINCSEEMIKGAKIAILPGDPGRVEFLAKMIDEDAKFITSNREYTSYLVNINNINVLVISTGMGGPSSGIALEELAMIGIEKFIRVGTCGTLQPNINIGDIIVTNASVRLDGTSFHYAPIEYPASASLELNASLLKSSKKIDRSVYFGITSSSDTFYPGQERKDSFTGYVRNQFQNTLEQWRNLNVLNFEMESSAVLTIANVFGLDATCICSVLAKRVESEEINKSQYDESMKDIINMIKDSIINNFYQ